MTLSLHSRWLAVGAAPSGSSAGLPPAIKTAPKQRIRYAIFCDLKGALISREKKTRLSDCAHEAAHAFAYWYLGYRVDLVEVFGRQGPPPVFPQPQEAVGRVCGEEIAFQIMPEHYYEPLRGWYCSKGIVRAEGALLMLAAGPVAEARARRSNEAAVWVFGGGTNDYKEARRIAGQWLEGDIEENLELACMRARALLLAPRAMRATNALAEVLRNRGRLDGEEVAVICARAFGEREPAREAWFEAWPPTLAQLREAHVPIYGDEDEALAARARRSYEILHAPGV